MDNEQKQRFAASLRHYRAMHGLSREEAAQKAGICANAYRRAENGQCGPDAEWVGRLCGFYGIPAARLFEPLDVPEAAFFTNRHRTRREQALQTETIRDALRWARDYRFLTDTLGCRPKTLPDVRSLSPAEAAGLVRKTFWEKGGFSPESFPGTLARYGICVYIAPFPDPETFGFSFRTDDCGWVIAVNSGGGESSERQLWHAAHELGHILLGSAGERHGKRSEAEQDAGLFASALLMPEAAFKNRWEDCAHLPFYDRVVAVKQTFHATANAVLCRITEGKPPEYRAGVMKRFNGMAKSRRQPNSRISEPASLNFDFGPDRFRSLALRVYRMGGITMSRLAELYRQPLAEIRKIVTETGRDAGDAAP